MSTAFLESNASFFDVFVIVSVTFLLLSGLIPTFFYFFKRDFKKVKHAILRLLASVCVGLGILIVMVVVSLALSLVSIPADYGLYASLIVAPLTAIVVNVVLMRMYK